MSTTLTSITPYYPHLQMLNLHPVPFMHSLHSRLEPLMDPQSNRNAEHYRDPFDPTVGVRNEIFSDAMKVSM